MTPAEFYAEIERQGRQDGQCIDLAALPSVILSDQRSLPLHAGVYFVFDSGGDVVYVGKSRNIRGRWSGKQHRVSKQMSDDSRAKIAWFEYRKFVATPATVLT